MRMRLLLLGGGSALGQAMIRLGAEEGIDFLAPRPPGAAWDAASLTRLIDETRPQALVNLAYYHDWFQARTVEPARFAEQLHAVDRLAVLCQHYGIYLVQPSSYRVFDGNRATAYDEKDEPQPLSVRGQALLGFEQCVRAGCSRHVLVRLGWLLDDSEGGMLDRFMRHAARGGEIELADDRRGNPTLVADAARVLLGVLKQLDCQAPLWGTYHYGAQEATTPLVLAESILAEARQLRAFPDLHFKAAPHSQLSDAAEEPQHGVLACRKIGNTFGIRPRAWRAGLPALLDRYLRNH